MQGNYGSFPNYKEHHIDCPICNPRNNTLGLPWSLDGKTGDIIDSDGHFIFNPIGSHDYQLAGKLGNFIVWLANKYYADLQRAGDDGSERDSS